MRVSRIAEIKLLATLKQKNIDNYFASSENKVLCIYKSNHILLKHQHIFQQKNMKILLLFLTKNPAKWDIFN